MATRNPSTISSRSISAIRRGSRHLVSWFSPSTKPSTRTTTRASTPHSRCRQRNLRSLPLLLPFPHTRLVFNERGPLHISVDAETKLRSDGHFDVEKARKYLRFFFPKE